ncbi:MAG TPA: DUF927 domain-containing protein [Amycolatopsis sp.]|nr:DUF927 domain-containing protein [Amycolatopsis sp.]
MSAPKQSPQPIDARMPKHELRSSSPGWRYSTGGPGERFPRGVYKSFGDGDWRLLAPLPYVFERLIQRGSTGVQLAMSYRMSMSPDQGEPGMVNVAYDDIKDGRWSQRLNVPLSGDPKIVQAVHTAILAVADKAPDCELAPRYVDGELELPPEDVAPAGYCRRAGTEDAAREAWAELIGIAAGTPKLALTLGAALGGLYIRAMHRQSFMLLLSGDAAQGKSTTTTASGALFGDPSIGAVVKSWNTTVNAVCQELGLYGMLTAFRDELGTAPGTIRRELESLLFQITEGGARNRGTRDGIPVMTAAWHGVMITSANTSILGQVTTEGASRRVLEIDTPITNNAAEAERIEELALSAYGWPLHWLREQGFDAEGFPALVKAAEQEIGLPQDGVARGIAKHLAIAVAGAVRLEQITATTGLRDAVLPMAREQLEKQVREIRENGATADERLWNAILSRQSAVPHAYPTREGYAKWYRGDLDAPQMAGAVEGWNLVGDDYPGDFAILTDVVERLAQTAKMDGARMALRELEKKGILLRCDFTNKGRPDTRRTHKLRVAGGRPPVYVFKVPGEASPAPEQEGDGLFENTATPQDRDTAVAAPDGPQAVPEPAAVESRTEPVTPAAATTGDDVLFIGRGGPVRYVGGSGKPCRYCDEGAPPTADDHGPVHAICAMSTPAPAAPTVPLTPVPNNLAPAASTEPVEQPRPAQATRTRPARRRAQGGAERPERARLPLAGVLDVEGLWLPEQDTPVPVDVPADAEAAYRLAADHNLRQLWFHPNVHEALGVPVTRELSATIGAATAIEDPWATASDGWKLDTGNGAGLAAWVNVAPPWDGARRIGLAFPAYDYNRTVWHTASTGKILLDAVLRFAAATAEPFYMSLNETSAAIVRKTAGENLTRLWRTARDLPEPVNAVKHLADWSRVLGDEEDLSGGWLHRYDINGAEAAVSSGVFIGVGEPEIVTLQGFDRAAMKKTAGYVLADVPREHVKLDPRLPDLLSPWRHVDQRPATAGGPAWAPVELLVLLDELGVPFKVSDALLWPTSERLLRGYGQRISKARLELVTADSADEVTALALGVTKALYKSRIGDFNRQGSRIYRPDIRDAIKVKATCNAYRSLRKIAQQSGRYPVAFHVDAAYYVADDSDICLAAPAGMGISRDDQGRETYSRELGKWKPEDSLLLAKVREHLGEKSFAAKFDKMLKKG